MSEFKREERYMVIKLSKLSNEEGETGMTRKEQIYRLAHFGKALVECVVVESDWPEYESTWRAIEERVTGAAMAQPSPAPELVNALRQYQHNDGSGLVFGYDKAETERIVGALQAELETERQRLAACGVAALGYFEGCADAYRSASLEDVLKLRAECDAAKAAQAWQVPGGRAEFSQFLSAVMDAAGLVKHGRRSKELSEY